MRNLYRALIAGLMAGWLLPAAPATAAVTNVDPMPGSFNLAMDQATAITITWRITRGGPFVRAVTSDSGDLRIGTTSITINRRLARPINGETSVILVETLVVPRSFLVRATKSGGSLLGDYTRSFFDGDGAAIDGVAIVRVTTGGAASFGISRLTLKFLDDDSRATVRAEDSRLRAVARIRFTGTGLLQAAWQIATPTSTPGNEIFRPLRLERRQLTGNGEVELISPPLPTSIQGQYFVALIVEDPGLGFETPNLIYTILPPGAPLVESPPLSILVSAPAPEGALAPGAKIVWSASATAAVYRIVLIDLPAEPLSAPQDDLQYGAAPEGVSPAEGRVVTGFYMPGTATEAALPALAASRLTSGQRYLLQIQALDGAGTTVAESRLQEVYWP
jgi:hypothetical protein